MSYQERSIDRLLDQFLPDVPAYALDGPKGVGKTATASRRADHVWNMELEEHRAHLLAQRDFEDLPTGTLFIDEWQNFPDSWNAVRRAVDDGAPGGRFLLAGSASPRLSGGTHSGAGRILSARMRPMGLHERDETSPTVSLSQLLRAEGPDISGRSDFSLKNYYDAIVGSGLPGLHQRSARIRHQYLDSYLHRIVDRDMPDLGYTVRRPAQLRRWMAAYAAASSTTTTLNRIAAAAGEDGEAPAKSTTIAYREYLTQLWILDPVEAWSPVHNPFKRLQQGPKHQLADPGLAARLLRLAARHLATPRYADAAGRLFESLVTLTVRAIAEAEGARVGHLRTHDSREEIDLIVEGDEGQVLAIEVKLAPDIRDQDVRHLKWLREKVSDDVVDTLVISTGEFAYRRADGVAVVPLALLGH